MRGSCDGAPAEHVTASGFVGAVTTTPRCRSAGSLPEELDLFCDVPVIDALAVDLSKFFQRSRCVSGFFEGHAQVVIDSKCAFIVQAGRVKRSEERRVGKE